MKLVLPLFAALSVLSGRAAPNLIPNAALRAGPDGRPAEWTTWAPRPGLAPAAALVARDGTPALSLQAKGYADYGRWVSLVRGIEPGKCYRLEAWHQAGAVETETVSVVAFLCWCRNADGTDELQRDYVMQDATAGGDWRRHARTVRRAGGRPGGARGVRPALDETGFRAVEGRELDRSGGPAAAGRARGDNPHHARPGADDREERGVDDGDVRSRRGRAAGTSCCSRRTCWTAARGCRWRKRPSRFPGP
ncbi:MAG: hypothetical protein WDM96_05085 [Lacunisphaera sp.]